MPPVDDERPSPEEREPPQLMVVLRQRIAELCAGRDDVVVDHTFRAEGVYRAGDGPGFAAYGRGTTVSPVALGLPSGCGSTGWIETWR